MTRSAQTWAVSLARRRATWMLLAAISSVVVVGCSAARDGATNATRSTRSSSSPTSACRPAQARAALASFVGAFNRGDYRRLDSLFAEPPLFRWYSSNQPGLRIDPAARTRDTLIRYFRSRRAKDDRLRLVSFHFTDNSGGYGNFWFKMRRSASDFRGGAWFGLLGKGAASCSTESVKLIVISLGGPDSDKG